MYFFPTIHTILAKLYKEANFFHDCQLQYGGLQGEGTKSGVSKLVACQFILYGPCTEISSVTECGLD
jgi:hypothetical protein